MKKVLYLGLEVPADSEKCTYLHCPLIEIIPYTPSSPSLLKAFKELFHYTHLLFTSKSAVSLFFSSLSFHGYSLKDLRNKKFIAVGKKTASKIRDYGDFEIFIASLESAEGVVALLETVLLPPVYLFWPHSQLSRSVISDYLKEKATR